MAVPFTPVPGSRLIALDGPARAMLVAALAQLAKQSQASSIHLLYFPDDEAPAVESQRWLARQGV